MRISDWSSDVCSSDLIADGQQIAIGGGVESISLVQTPEIRIGMDEELLAMHPTAYIQMIDTAEVVAKRYGIGREAQDEYAPLSQRRTAAAQAAGTFGEELIPELGRGSCRERGGWYVEIQ